MESTGYGNTLNNPNPLNNPGLSNTADNALNKAASTAHSAVDSVASAADDAARKVKPKIDKVAAMAHQAVDKAADVAGEKAEWLAHRGTSLNASKDKLVSDTCSYVSANPLKSVGIAVLAGFVLSRILL